MLKDIHQSKKYGQYMEKIGWIVERANGCQIFIRRFPIIGSLIKIQRPTLPAPLEEIEKVSKKFRAFKIIIEPEAKSLFRRWPRKTGTPRTVGRSAISQIESAKTTLQLKRQLKKFGYKRSNSPYLPTKTIFIDLTKSEDKIFQEFSESKRRAVRRALKNNIIVKESKNIESFIKLKSCQFFPFGFLIKRDINALWQTFSPKNTCLLSASVNIIPLSHPEVDSGSSPTETPKQVRNDNSKFLAGILLLFHQKTAHYWLAASTKKGNKLFAPTLLVWEALKFSKKRGFKIFDFQGIYDPRFHQATKFWQGFTRFKKGFGGEEVEYPGCFVKLRFPF